MRAWAAALGLALGVGGCGTPDSVLEWSWAIVDRDGTPVFPTGVFQTGRRSSCRLPGETEAGTTRFDLTTELQICDTGCEQGCNDPDCLVLAPLEYGCELYRGSNAAVPASDTAYRFTLVPVLNLANGKQCRQLNGCLAAPGPRERVLKPGLVTDLQVFQLIVDLDQSQPEPSVDLGACDCA